jgi:hypothetical protein
VTTAERLARDLVAECAAAKEDWLNRAEIIRQEGDEVLAAYARAMDELRDVLRR